MENIIEPNDSFDFSQITMISPTSVAGGNYFIRCLAKNQTPLYIQPPKCKTKQGIVKSGNKKMYCDLMFSHDDEIFLRWVEQFEEYCQTKLYENRAKWFDSEMDRQDIEMSFVSSFKNYKSGKLQLLRTHIPLRLGKCALKIYNEEEKDVPPESVLENSNLMTILEIQGIKCSTHSFQLEIEIKQMMILNPVDLFEKCIFTKDTSKKP
jgi:hypothetical protein